MKLFLKRTMFVLLVLLLMSPCLVFVVQQIEAVIYFSDMQGEILFSYYYYDLYSYNAEQRKHLDINMENNDVYQMKSIPNTRNAYIGVNYENELEESICVFSQDEQGQFVVKTKILMAQRKEESIVGLVYAPQFIPNSNAISFKKDGFYWIYNLDDETTTPIEIKNAYSLVWLDDHTFLYTVSDIEHGSPTYEFRNVSIRKHDLETKIDSLYLENAYGCSLSSNREFLAYGIATKQNEKSGKIMIQNIDGTHKQEIKSPAPSIYDHPYRVQVWGEYHIDPRDDTGAPLTSTRYREWNSVDTVCFQPSPDGEYLAFGSDATSGHKSQRCIIDCQTGKKMLIGGGLPITMDWVE